MQHGGSQYAARFLGRYQRLNELGGVESKPESAIDQWMCEESDEVVNVIDAGVGSAAKVAGAPDSPPSTAPART